jgi:hypothetical protein
LFVIEGSMLSESWRHRIPLDPWVRWRGFVGKVVGISGDGNLAVEFCFNHCVYVNPAECTAVTVRDDEGREA